MINTRLQVVSFEINYLSVIQLGPPKHSYYRFKFQEGYANNAGLFELCRIFLKYSSNIFYAKNAGRVSQKKQDKAQMNLL